MTLQLQNVNQSVKLFGWLLMVNKMENLFLPDFRSDKMKIVPNNICEESDYTDWLLVGRFVRQDELWWEMRNSIRVERKFESC